MTTNAQDYMDLPNPAAQGRANKEQALMWIYVWVYSTPAILQLLLRHQGMSWSTGAVASGWLRKTGVTTRERIKVLTLSEMALAWVQARSNLLLKYAELDPHRMSPYTIHHGLLAQRLTVHEARAGRIDSYQTERMLAARSEPGVKQPDMVWTTKAGERVAVEVELTAKWDRRLDEFLLKNIKAMTPEAGNERQRVDRVLITTTSPAILKRYRMAFGSGQPYRVWRDSINGKSVNGSIEQVPTWVQDQVHFRLVDERGMTISDPLNRDLP
jgi:hypothetical protein